MSRFLNSGLRQLREYTPGEQPQDRKYIKLNTNESPFAPSEKVVRAISASSVESLRLYCDPTASKLKTALAKEYRTKEENIFVSNGSDEVLNFAFMAFGERGVIFPDISYGFYEVFARLYSLPYTKAPLNDDFSINTSDYFNTGKLVVIANPNAPTGIALSLSEIEKILIENRDSVVVIDEAYVDFGAESSYSLTQKYDNLLTVMTYSKSRSMAGARLGFAIGNAELIGDLEKIKYSTNPYNVNSLTQIAGIATLSDSEYYKENCRTIIKNREYTAQALTKLGFSVLPSMTNFVFAKHEKVGGETVYKKLKENGILVRHFSDEKIKDYNRITIGTRENMQTLILTLEKIINEEKTKYENGRN